MIVRQLAERLLLAVLVMTFLLPANAVALVTVSGKITDRESGESIPGVTVMVEGTQRGAAANVEGFFSIADLPPGEIRLVFTALGYRPLKRPLTLKEGDNQNLSVKLLPEALEMPAVEIVAEREGEREYTPKVAQYSLETRQLAELPQLVESDLFRSLQIMPGVLASSDYSSELNIWGGSNDQNLILLNGIEVYKPTHLGGLFSVFNMDAIKDVKMIKGGFPAKYGGRVSAVLDIADREGNRYKRQGKVGISFLSSHATLEGPFPRGSWLVAGRRTYLDAATKLLKDAGAIEDDLPYYFYDLNGKVTRDFANGDRLSPSAYLGRDVLQLTSTTDDRIRMTWGNATYSVPYVHIWHPKLFSMTTVAGSFFDSRFRFETADAWSEFTNTIRDYTFKTDLSYFATARHTFDAGLEAKRLEIAFRVAGSSETYHDRDYDGWQLGTYVSDDVRPTDRLTITPGLRVDHNTLSGYTEYLPRISLKQELTEKSSLSAAFGLYSQPLQQVTFGEGFASIFNAYILLDETFSSNRARHYVLNYENDLDGPLKLSAGLYVKEFHHIVQFNPRQVVEEQDQLDKLFEEGNGYAYGGDLLVQGDWDRFSFLWGYALGRSKQEFDFWDNGLDFPARFDRLHNTNLFLSRKVGKNGTLEMRFNYGSGQPITRPIGVYTIGADLPPQYFDPGRKNHYRMPAYHRLDVAFRWRIEKKHWTFLPYVEIINLYNRKNVLMYDYELDKNPIPTSKLYQLPLLPSIGFTAEF